MEHFQVAKIEANLARLIQGEQGRKVGDKGVDLLEGVRA
jgi:hypothetical protein